MAEASIAFHDWGEVMHFRPAAEIVETVKRYDVPVYLRSGEGLEVSADSIINLMTLQTDRQMTVRSDSEAALADVMAILEDLHCKSH
ncbi:MAG: HPr family phosphocarrier protein [Varibaculum sp.]|nr:HPr family phosphocarrier protein [Varibaculum sp.]